MHLNFWLKSFALLINWWRLIPLLEVKSVAFIALIFFFLDIRCSSSWICLASAHFLHALKFVVKILSDSSIALTGSSMCFW